MVLDPISQCLPVHIFGSRPQPPTSRLHIDVIKAMLVGDAESLVKLTLLRTAEPGSTAQYEVQVLRRASPNTPKSKNRLM